MFQEFYVHATDLNPSLNGIKNKLLYSKIEIKLLPAETKISFKVFNFIWSEFVFAIAF